jgi:hypothetical protein
LKKELIERGFPRVHIPSRGDLLRF